MAEHSITLIIMMIVAIAILFASIVLAAMASSSAKENCPQDETANSYSLYSAIASGVAVFILAIALLIYIFYDPSSDGDGTKTMSGEAHQTMQKHLQAAHEHTQKAVQASQQSSRQQPQRGMQQPQRGMQQRQTM